MIKRKLKSNRAFMGLTHSTSALTIYLLLTSLFPAFFFGQTEDSMLIFILSILVVAGAALMPDFDSAQSTAISTLGILGKGISTLVRNSNKLIRRTIRGKHDDNKVDPHRGFTHTLISGLLAGLIVVGLTSISIEIPLPFIEESRTLGFVFSVVILTMCVKLAIASLMHKGYKKITSKLPFCNAITYLISIIAVFPIMLALPADQSYLWLGFALFVGWTLHIIADSFTSAGCPLFFPLAKKGKRWWMYRIPPGVKTGGKLEDGVLIPIFLGLSIFAIVRLFIL
jgi:membrane-bound metal-dependent hydrolase YbcI (DUF457 family)